MGLTYALCRSKPICKRICRGERCSLKIFVGVGFLRGGSRSMSNNKIKIKGTCVFFSFYKNNKQNK